MTDESKNRKSFSGDSGDVYVESEPGIQDDPLVMDILYTVLQSGFDIVEVINRHVAATTLIDVQINSVFFTLSQNEIEVCFQANIDLID